MAMPPDRKIWTWYEGRWQEGNVPIMGSADHGTWLGTMVFDGARAFEGVTPDLEPHCARVNHSAVAMGMNPTMETGALTSDLDSTRAETDGRVTGSGPLGDLEAGRLRVLPDGEGGQVQMFFTDGVKLIYQPPAKDIAE